MLPVARPATTCSPKSSQLFHGAGASTICGADRANENSSTGLVPQIRPAHVLVLSQPLALVFNRHAAGLQDVPVTRHRQGQHGVLLHEEYCDAVFVVDPLD